jgi:protein-tyrosine-phosphatase
VTHFGTDGTFVPHILVVCHANQIRSPIAEFLLRRHFAASGASATVSSAGTHAEPDLAVHRFAAEFLRDQGIETGNWRSRRLTDADIDNADLILTMQRQQLAFITRAVPHTARRTLPFLGLARLSTVFGPLPRHDAETFHSTLMDELAAARSRVAASDDDLPDPVGKGRGTVRRAGARIDDATRAIAAALAR